MLSLILSLSRVLHLATRQIDNERVIVTEWRFAPGAETGWHRHDHDYVICPVTPGRMLLENPDGVAEAVLQPGQTYFRETGVEHNVINNNDYPFRFIEVEFK